MNIRRLKLQSSMPQIHHTMNIIRLETVELLTTDTPHQTMQQHLIPKKNTNVKRNPELSLLKNYKKRSAQNWKLFATGS